MNVSFNDLKPLHQSLSSQLDESVRRVLASGWFLLGPEGERFEQQFASYIGVEHVIGLASGTDAIELMLRASDIGQGDEVITVAHTAVATVCAVERVGARPVLVDIDEKSYTMDPAAAEAAITPRTKAILPVHLYGHPAQMVALTAVATRHGLLLLEDCAQATGAKIADRLVGAMGHMAAFSFYPTKNLGACGDAGAIATHDRLLAERVRSLRNYGQTARYHHVEVGTNSRLDEIQAAILTTKLAHLDRHNANRRELAADYQRQLAAVQTPSVAPDAEHVFHLYVIRSPHRDELQQSLAGDGIATLIHYPIPVHLQPAYEHLGYPEGSLPGTESAAKEILSLPLYVGMSDAVVDLVASSVEKAAAAWH